MNRAHQTSIVLEPAKKPYVAGEVLVHSADGGWDRAHVVVIDGEVMSLAPRFRPSVRVQRWEDGQRVYLPTAELYREVHP